MKINQALTKIAALKGKVSRQAAAIEKSLVHYEDDEEKKSFDFSHEEKMRKDLSLEIFRLKVNIQLTNALTKVKYRGQTMSLAELILLNAEKRAELGRYAQLNEKELVDNRYGYGEQRTKDQLKKIYAKGFEKKEIEAEIEALEAEKDEISSLIIETNITTDLVK